MLDLLRAVSSNLGIAACPDWVEEMSRSDGNPWVVDIAIAMSNLGGKASYDRLYEEVRRVRPGPLPRSWQAIVRNVIESYSSDSDNYSPERADLFYSVEGKGRGVWGLRIPKK